MGYLRLWIGIGILNLLAVALTAQAEVFNPFNITARLPEKTKALAIARANNTITDLDSAANPFNVMPHRLPGVARGISESVEQAFRPLEALPKGDALPDNYLFWILMTLVAFLSFAIASKRSVVIKAWQGFLNDNALTIAQKEAARMTGSTPYYLLYVSFLLNAGAFIFLIARYFNQKAFNNLGFLAICMALSFGLFLAKHVLLWVVRWLYPVAKEVRRYNFLILIFNCVLGLFLVPFNFLVAFVQEYADFMVFWTLSLAGIFYLYRSVRAAGIGQKYLSGHVFHFLLYLCTVEIAPVIILLKLALLASE
ncbi:MAG: DUF4271 domain-containing protein [Bacteroidetes bacterium]|nr:MAG: DUF4271 domain-containing protein [Bacteroidota bacterium]